MHILIIPSWYTTPAEPIRGSFFRDQALALQKAGHQVGMLVPPGKLRTWHGLAEVRHHWRQSNTNFMIEDDAGMPIYRIPWWGWLPSIAPWRRGALGIQVFDRYCAECGTPDVLHGHSILYGGYLAAYIGQKRGIPAVLTEHSSTFRRNLILPGQGYFVRYALRHFGRRFAVSPPLAQSLKDIMPDYPVEIMPNVVDTAFFVPGTIDQPERPFVFAAVGRLNRGKGHQVLVQAFGAAFRDQNVCLRIAGEGPYRKPLEDLIRQLGLQQQVQLMGMLSREQVRDLLQQSHAVASASFFENHPVSLVEAMACGKPIVATRCNGPEFFVEKNIGLLVPIKDVDRLASALQDMVQNYNRYDPDQIRSICVEQFGEEAFVRRIEQVYRELVYR